jgi:hypothetical protein
MTVVSSADLTKQKQEVDLGFPTDLPPQLVMTQIG